MRSKSMMKPVAHAAGGSGCVRWALRHCRSPAVQSWRPPQLPGARAGSLYARVDGDDDRVAILLHGLVSTGGVFGAAFDRIVCWGAPIYPSPDMSRARISDNAMARLFMLETRWAERACAIICRYRTAAGWLAAAAEPVLPVAVSRAASHHTWPAYRDALRHLVIETDWSQLLGDVRRTGVHVELTWGVHDPVGDKEYARSITSDESTSAISRSYRAPTITSQ